MDKIDLDDIVLTPDENEGTQDSGDKVIEENKEQKKKQKKSLKTILNKVFTIISIKNITAFLNKINIYRRIRESFITFYLSKTVAAKKKDLTMMWQPPLFVIFKIAVVAFISYKIYGLHPVVGSWFKLTLDFFKLHEIYNFTFPSRSFFDTIAGYLFLFIIGYHGIYFLYHQIQGLFSALVVNKAEQKIYYIKNFFIKKDLFIFSIPDIALVVLKQNIISRLFGLGTISLQKRSGEHVMIRTIQHAHLFLKSITGIKKPDQMNKLEND